MATLFRQQGNYSQTVVHLTEAIRLDPYWLPSYQILQYLSIPQELLPKLIDLYQNIVQKEPQLYYAWSNLGDIFTRVKNTNLAIICYRKANYYKTIKYYPQLANIKTQSVAQGCNPDFIIIGELKCGTTSLYEYLSQHPQIITPFKKELNFFNWHFEQGLAWYQSHFSQASTSTKLVTGEASPSYFAAPQAAKRMATLFPQVKLIVLLRNPIDRCLSHFHHCIRDGLEKKSLEQALNSEIKLVKSAIENQPYPLKGYLGNSLYFYKLKYWLSLFPRHQILIIKSEDLYQQPGNTMSQVFSWLNLPQEAALNYGRYNFATYNSMEEGLRQQLAKFFEPHNRLLETYLGRKFNWS